MGEPLADIRIADGVATLDADAWARCAGSDDPFVSHAFLAALEESLSVGGQSGWQPVPIIAAAPDGAMIGALPAYLKAHSQGEYVFDHSWADAYERAGGQYYPKLQIAVPFTPVPGPRVLANDDAVRRRLIAAAQTITVNNGLSSAHATFLNAQDKALFEAAGWLIRQGIQFQWTNQGYTRFDDFLATLSARKRKTIRHERSIAARDLTIIRLTGDAIRPHHWDAVWRFYQDTGARKWGHPYLTRSFFSIMGRAMADRVLLIIALRDDQPIAGALNLIGSDALYGRYWGCTEDVPFLHFELCYYQAIEEAIARGLARVEAGAQGAHKLARGYLPACTYSAHFIADQGFRAAVQAFLDQEDAALAQETAALAEMGPYRKAP